MESKSKEFKKTICPLDCPDSCGLIAIVKNGKIIGLSGDKEHGYTRGVICRKMKNYHQRLYSAGRILHPMQRVGRKGSTNFERISWDHAYAILAEKINHICRKYGGEAILPFAYAGNMGVVNRFAGYPLFHKLGTARLEETICSSAARAGWKSHCGDISGSPPETAAEAQLIIIWGSNTKVTNMHFWPYVAQARKKGAKLVVIDPYRNMTAASADIHLRVCPGEDAALALGLLKILLERNDIDRDFIAASTTGFTQLEHYLQKTALSAFCEQSGIELSRLKELAKLISARQRLFIRLGIGMTRNSRAAMSIRAITSLAAALGLFDGKTGQGVLLTSRAFTGDQEKLVYSSLAEKQTRMFNMVQLGNCLSTSVPPIKMLFVYNANPLSAVPDGSLVREAMGGDNLFTVVHEQVMTPTATYADLLLPATTFLENKDLYIAYGHFYLGVAEPVIAPCGESKSNFTFFQELASKLGFTDSPFKQSFEERMSSYWKTLDGLPEKAKREAPPSGQAILSTRCQPGRPLFNTTTGKYSFYQNIDPALPQCACLVAADEFDGADYQARYPLKLITPPHMKLLNSTFGERYVGELGEVFIHPVDSLRYAIRHGDRVVVYNDRGFNYRIARITEATSEGMLVAEGLFWQNQANPTGINDLTSQKLTDMGGGGTYHESQVAIKVADDNNLIMKA